MVDLAMNIFVFLTKFLIFWYPWHSWVCIRSDLKPLFETDMSNSFYSEILRFGFLESQLQDFLRSILVKDKDNMNIFSISPH